MSRAADIVKALGGRWHGSYGVARCPGHDDRSPSLSIADGSRRAVVFKCHAGCEWQAILDALRNLGLWGGAGDLAVLDWRDREPPQPDRNRRKLALDMWAQTVPAAGSTAETYLRGRGLTLPIPGSLRFAPRLNHTPTSSVWPAMVAGVVDVAGQLMGVHRTYLQVDGGGKAPVSPNRMMFGAVHGGAVRLAAADARVAIAEGIETGLAFQMRTGIPTWAALSTSGMRGIAIPRSVRDVTLAADGDPAGRDAAEAAAKRLAKDGRSVRVVYAPEGRDFADLIGDAAGQAGAA